MYSASTVGTPVGSVVSARVFFGNSSYTFENFQICSRIKIGSVVRRNQPSGPSTHMKPGIPHEQDIKVFCVGQYE